MFFGLQKITNTARQLASQTLSSAATFLVQKTVTGITETKNTGMGGDVGWSSFGGMGSLTGPAGSGQLNVGIGRFRNTGEFIGAFTADDVVNSCALLLAETIAGLDWKLRHRQTGTILSPNSEDAIDSSAGNNAIFRDASEWRKYCELVSLIKKPNPYQDWFEFIALQQMYYSLTGNALTLRDNLNALGWAEFLWPLNPAWIQPVVTPSEGLLGYYYQDGASFYAFEPENISHAKRTNPGSPFFWGVGVVQALAGVLDSQVGIDEYQRSFFQNGAVLSGLIYSDDPDFDPDVNQFKTLRSQIKEQFQGVRNHFKVAVLTNGMKWQNVSLSQVDMGMIDWKKLGEDRILRGFRVPKSKLGQQDDAQYSKLDAADRMFYKEAIAPLAKMWSARLSADVTSYFGYDLIFDVPQFDDITSQVLIVKHIDTLNSLTLWEKRKSMKKLCPSLIFEDDPDSPYNSSRDKLKEEPSLHLLYNSNGDPIARLSASDIIEIG